MACLNPSLMTFLTIFTGLPFPRISDMGDFTQPQQKSAGAGENPDIGAIKIYYCRLVRLGLWEPIHNKPCGKIFHDKFCRKPCKTLRVGKHSTTSMVENIPQQSLWETFYNLQVGLYLSIDLLYQLVH